MQQIEVDWVSETRNIRTFKDAQTDIREFAREFKLSGLKLVAWKTGPNSEGDEITLTGSKKTLEGFIAIYSPGSKLKEFLV